MKKQNNETEEQRTAMLHPQNAGKGWNFDNINILGLVQQSQSNKSKPFFYDDKKTISLP